MTGYILGLCMMAALGYAAGTTGLFSKTHRPRCKDCGRDLGRVPVGNCPYCGSWKIGL